MSDKEKELANALLDVLEQACLDYNKGFYNSNHLLAYADGLRLLCRLGVLELVNDNGGRGVIARRKTK